MQANGGARQQIPHDIPMNGNRRRSPEAETEVDAEVSPGLPSNSSYESSESTSQESSDPDEIIQIENADLTNVPKSEMSTSNSSSPSPVCANLGKHKFPETLLFSSESEDSDIVQTIKKKKNNNYYSNNHEERSTDCLDSKKHFVNSYDSEDSEDY